MKQKLFSKVIVRRLTACNAHFLFIFGSTAQFERQFKHLVPL